MEIKPLLYALTSEAFGTLIWAMAVSCAFQKARMCAKCWSKPPAAARVWSSGQADALPNRSESTAKSWLTAWCGGTASGAALSGISEGDASGLAMTVWPVALATWTRLYTATKGFPPATILSANSVIETEAP